MSQKRAQRRGDLDRIAQIGWEDTNIRLAAAIAWLLTDFKNAPRTGFPSTLASEEEWESILDEMIQGFSLAANEEKAGILDDEEMKALNRSLELFVKWFDHLWD